MRRRLYWLAPAIGACALASVFALLPGKTTQAQPGPGAPGSSATPLPIKNVVLFSSGVGYFQRKGEIDGSARVDLTFQVRDVNDLIKSLVIQDEAGQVSAVSYDSLDPVDRTLKSFAVDLTNNPTFAQILQQLRGEKIEVVLNQTANNQPGQITGSVLGIEKQKVASKDGAVETEMLTMWCAEGVRSVRLSELQRLRFLSPTIESEFRRALDTLAQSHDAQKKAVSLSFVGNGKREVKVGYVVENPIWKTSYRLVLDPEGKPFLQAWAVVDNPTDDDWNDVGMALVSGRPVSFQMDLYQPLYVPRPTVELELFQSLRPVAYDSGRRARRPGEPEVAAAESATPAPPGMAGPAAGMGMGGFGGGAPSPQARAGISRDAARKRGEQLAREMNERMNLSQGVQSAASAQQLGDSFQYIIKTPVNLPRQKSALLPIANTEIEGTRLSIYNPNVHAKFPMLGLKLKNSSGLHLMQGPITVFEGSTYSGDARINDLPPNEERLISYAVDLGTEVETKVHVPAQQLTNVRIQNGIIWRTDKHREEKTYTATNRSGQPKTIWIEHPNRAEFKIVSDLKPVEQTQDLYRFEMKLPQRQGQSVSQTIIEEQDLRTQLAISNTDDGTIRIFMNSRIVSENVKKELTKVLELKATLNTTRQELTNVNEQLRVISEDQTRLRANLREVPTQSAAYKRYVEKFDKQETEIESLRDKQRKLQEQQLKDQRAVDTYLRNLNVQ